MSEQRITVHCYAECNPSEATHAESGEILVHQPGDVVAWMSHGTDIRQMPVRYLGTREEIAPPAPREVVTYHFEEVAEPEADEEGLYWLRTLSGGARRIRCPKLWQAAPNEPWLRRTVTRTTAKPEVWRGEAIVQSCGNLAYASAREKRNGPADFAFVGGNRTSPASAEADLVILRRLAEQYAAHHGAVVEWETKG